MSIPRKLRGYMVSGDRKGEFSGVLVFAHTARDAKRMAWHYPVDVYMEVDSFTGVHVRWLRSADPQVWGITEPCAIEPDGCDRCERWYADAPVDPKTRLCRECAADPERELDW